MSGPEFAGAALSALDSVMAVVNDIRARITRIENEDRRRAEQRAVAAEFHRQQKDFFQ